MSDTPRTDEFETRVYVGDGAWADQYRDLIALCRELERQCHKSRDQMKVTDEMVDRFLSWRLPITAMPDACVMDRSHDRQGTHVLSFTEAKAMLEHVLSSCDDSKSGTHEDTRRLRRFAEMALAVEGKDETFGSQLTADRELGFLREDFLGEHAKGADAYTAFCRAIDNLTDSAELPPKPGGSE